MMETLITAFQEALASLDKVRADTLFQQALETRSPIAAVE